MYKLVDLVEVMKMERKTSERMIDKMLTVINKAFPLSEMECGEYATQKVSGMKFQIRRFKAEGLGSVSVMVAGGFFGLMKMDTLIINPTFVDMPLYSYDRVNAMGNDTLIFELYDTLLAERDLSALETIKENAKELPEHDLGKHWYDSIKLDVSLSKKGKKQHSDAFDSCTIDYLNAFLKTAKQAVVCDPALKREKASIYVEGLLEHGGPSTDVFKKGIGEEKTAILFRKILFATEEEKHWVSVWGNATSIITNKPERYAKDITLRYPIYVPFGGEAVRFTFDNLNGTEAVTITKATVLYDGKFYPVFHDGKREMTIPATEKIVTDELPIEVKGDETLEVSFYLGDFTLMRAGVTSTGPLSKGVYSNGEQTENAELCSATTNSIQQFYFLTNVSVLTEKENRSIVCFGDSITSQAWPDYLKLRLKEEGYKHTAIIKRGVSGSRMLRQYNCIAYEGYGIAGVTRYPHDLPTDGADTVIILHGINDIIHPVGADVNEFRPWSDLPTAEDLIEGFKGYVKLARELGYKVYAGTLMPIDGWRTNAPFRQEIRHAFNDFIRTTDIIDGVIDFDKAIQDTDNQEGMFAEYDSGDHLHPGAKGHHRMAMEIPKELLK